VYDVMACDEHKFDNKQIFVYVQKLITMNVS